MPKRSRTTLDEIVAHFEDLEDPRSPINRRHPLVSVLVISVVAVLAGAEGPTGIHKWAELKRDLLLKILELPNGIPSKDVFRRVLMAVDPVAFQSCFFSWLESISPGTAGAEQRKHLAVDGKTLRGSHDSSKGLGPLHLVSAWLSSRGITMGQVATSEKSNEITAIPELLKLIDIKGAIITLDAMGTQTAIAKQIVESKGDYVMGLKANQGNLHGAAIKYLEDCAANSFKDVPVRRHTEHDEGHGRKETRFYLQVSVPGDLKGRDRWRGLKTLGLVIRTTEKGGQESIETRYYISSLPLGVKQFARVVRGHWGIENTCHWSLDVTYREDALRTRNRRIAENLAWLRRFTLSLIKQSPGRESYVMKRRMCGWNDDFLLQVLLSQQT